MLSIVRRWMKSRKQVLDYLIVTSSDAHCSEYVRHEDKIRERISSFSGSNGHLLIGMDEAFLWTDGRYYLQATKQLSSDWKLMKEDDDKMEELLVEKESSKIGLDFTRCDIGLWNRMTNIKFIDISTDGFFEEELMKNFVETNGEYHKRNGIFLHDSKFSGIHFSDKKEELCNDLKFVQSSHIIISSLDEIAWLLNLRCLNEFKYVPFFLSFVIVSSSGECSFFCDNVQSESVQDYLKSNNIKLFPYNHFYDFLQSLLDNPINTKIQMDLTANVKLYQIIPEEKRSIIPSPIARRKCIKNPTEINGSINAHNRDSIALNKFLRKLENCIRSKEKITEIDASNMIHEERKKNENFVSDSFEAISASGPNGAIIHYRPENEYFIQPSLPYLLDSGGHYLDGTTDVTRTIFFQEQPNHIKEMYTKVIKAHIGVASLKIPKSYDKEKNIWLQLDAIARSELWKFSGDNYLHGTGHGVGYFLGVHEKPIMSYRYGNGENITFRDGMIITIEPGFYSTDNYGIRFENCYLTELHDDHYTFRPLTLVPIDTNNLLKHLLNKKEMEWINNYHHLIQKEISGNITETVDTLMEKTIEWDGTEYKTNKFIGKGSFGKCYLFDGEHDTKIAVKYIEIRHHSAARLEKLTSEVMVQSNLIHSNVVQLFNVLQKSSQFRILLEYCPNQDLSKLLEKRNKLTIVECRFFMRHIMEGVKFIHDKNYVHCDLKPNNIFLSDGLIPKIGDFGLITSIYEDERHIGRGKAGTSTYMAPEIIRDYCFSYASDIWALGVIFYKMLDGQLPFNGTKFEELFKNMLEPRRRIRRRDVIDAELLLDKMFEVSMEYRITLREMEKDAFFKTPIPLQLPLSAFQSIPTFTQSQMRKSKRKRMSVKTKSKQFEEFINWITCGDDDKLKENLKEMKKDRLIYVDQWWKTANGLCYLLNDGTKGIRFTDNSIVCQFPDSSAAITYADRMLREVEIYQFNEFSSDFLTRKCKLFQTIMKNMKFANKPSNRFRSRVFPLEHYLLNNNYQIWYLSNGIVQVSIKHDWKNTNTKEYLLLMKEKKIIYINSHDEIEDILINRSFDTHISLKCALRSFGELMKDKCFDLFNY
ncbi:hypothetical protein SNEBB_004529 [Seison nebaliae]|nr:hypothetical protein SNEBB_004529 [Seison nebaliae]